MVFRNKKWFLGVKAMAGPKTCFVTFRLLLATSAEGFKAFCSAIVGFGTARLGKKCLLPSNRLMKTEHMKVGQGRRSKGEACFDPTKERPGQGANKFAHSKNLFGVRVACHRFVSVF
jgi:hypothetical protein